MAIYISKGIISEMSEVTSGVTQNGKQWQRMTLTLDIPGYQGSITKQVFGVFGDDVNDVLLFSIGDKVEVSWTMYAREWNGRLYNNVDLVKIMPQESKPVATPPANDDLDVETHRDDLPF